MRNILTLISMPRFAIHLLLFTFGAHFTVFLDETVGFTKNGLPTIGTNVTIFGTR